MVPTYTTLPEPQTHKERQGYALLNFWPRQAASASFSYVWLVGSVSVCSQIGVQWGTIIKRLDLVAYSHPWARWRQVMAVGAEGRYCNPFCPRMVTWQALTTFTCFVLGAVHMYCCEWDRSSHSCMMGIFFSMLWYGHSYCDISSVMYDWHNNNSSMHGSKGHFNCLFGSTFPWPYRWHIWELGLMPML